MLAINDLGMHCGDLDTRIVNILPPFQVLLAQVVRKGGRPTLNPPGVDVYYSAASNPGDPALGDFAFPGMKADGSTYKTNFWDAVAAGTYDPFYPAFNPFDPAVTLTPLAGPPFNVGPDVGLPVPNVEDLYIGADGIVGSSDEELTAVLHAMPGVSNPYVANAPQQAQENYRHKPFFIGFPFGYVASDVDWYEGAGVPFAMFDDFGRENAYPLVRVQATVGGSPPDGDNVVATVDTVLPISGEASCVNCHTTREDHDLVHDDGTGETAHRTEAPVTALGALAAGSVDDPRYLELPQKVSLEYAADINILRLHDLKHGARYVTSDCGGPLSGDDCTLTVPDPCTISAADPNGSASCLSNQALVQGRPVVCQVCHYTPALDLAQLGPLAGPPGTVANGRNQLAHRSNSNVMHGHHGALEGAGGEKLFPDIEPPDQQPDGSIANQEGRLAALDQTCYQCHPGRDTRCGMVCSDCHGNMAQVGNDFSANVSPSNAGLDKLILGGNFYDPADPQPRVPWAHEPGCGSCHTGDANDNLAGAVDAPVNTADSDGNVDGIRLRQAFRVGDPKATPIVPVNKRFAEPVVPAVFEQPGADFPNPAAGSPRLYRLSTGHGGVMCEGCHGATHAEWPNANPDANDNVTANQLQGHTGTLIECDTCHVTSELPDDTQGGPHGMHLVNDRRFWDEGHEDLAERENRRPGGGSCGACHGADHRGTVLSRAAVTRSFVVEGRTRTVQAGQPVACDLCHSLEDSFER